MSTADNRKSSSFSNASKHFKGTTRIKPLTREFFTQLLKLETDFYNKTYTVVILDELIQFYAKAVEYYDSVKDEISSYFMFKIQDILATKKSLKLLFEENTKVGGRKGTGTLATNESDEAGERTSDNKKVTFEGLDDKKPSKEEVLVEENSEEEREDDEEEKQFQEFEKRRQEKKARREQRMSISTMKSQKQRFVNFFYKMETQKASEKQNMNVLVDKFDVLAEKNDPHVKKDIDNQRERLRRRLDKRKAESFMSHTMNANSFAFGKSLSTFDEAQERKESIKFTKDFFTKRIDQEIFENFLQGLEDQEKDLGNKEGSERMDLKSTDDEKTFSESNTNTFKPEKSPKNWEFMNRKKFKIEGEDKEAQDEKDKENIAQGRDCYVGIRPVKYD